MLRVAALLVTAAIAGCGGGGEESKPRQADPNALPAPSAPFPREAGPLAQRLTQTTDRLREEIDTWRKSGDISTGGPPEPVTLLALHQQRIIRFLVARRTLARATVTKLPARLRPWARDTLAALTDLRRLTPPAKGKVKLKTGRPKPAGVLLRHYAKADRRFGVSRNVLAAVNFVESAFGKLRNDSTAGARGPMQFIPSTWRAYGLGGDIHDPHDAVMGAANYLRASGAPRNYRRALFAYNRSTLYVDAVLRYARRMRRDRRDLLAFYSWQVYVRTHRGDKRLTGPRD